MPQLTPEELAAMIAKLDEVCRQSQELQKKLRTMMDHRARMDRLADEATRPSRRRRTRKSSR